MDSTRRRPPLSTQLSPSPPYKRHPRAPSPQYLPIPCIDSLHPCPYCPPIELCRRPFVPHYRRLTSSSPLPRAASGEDPPELLSLFPQLSVSSHPPEWLQGWTSTSLLAATTGSPPRTGRPRSTKVHGSMNPVHYFSYLKKFHKYSIKFWQLYRQPLDL
jgi:hypothetical protein